MSNTANLPKRTVHGSLIGLLACASMADARAKASLPDMTTTLREHRVESASVAVIRNGRIVSTEAWGMAGPNRATTVATPYNLASLTKPLTARGTCGMKAIQYMGIGIPAVVSPVGANREIVTDGVTGFHAATCSSVQMPPA